MIFVQIASYRDPFLRETVQSLLNNASFPNKLKVCVCRQFHPDDKFDILDEYYNDDRFIILDIPYLESKGVGWARNLIQKQYKNEEYTLQIDSHTLFIKNWDQALIQMMKELQLGGFPKPIISYYPPVFSLNDDKKVLSNKLFSIGLRGYRLDGSLIIQGATLKGVLSDRPYNSMFYAAGFSFSLGIMCIEIPHDPSIYFQGEEITIAARAYTHGYDIFHPNRIISWHYYKSSNNIFSHWNDHKNWTILNSKSLLRVNELLGINCKRISQTEYGLGQQRPFSIFEEKLGVNFSKMGIVLKRDKIIFSSEDQYRLTFFRKVIIREANSRLDNLKRNHYQLRLLDCDNNIIYKTALKNRIKKLKIFGKTEMVLYFYSRRKPKTWEIMENKIQILRDEFRTILSSKTTCDVF